MVSSQLESQEVVWRVCRVVSRRRLALPGGADTLRNRHDRGNASGPSIHSPLTRLAR